MNSQITPPQQPQYIQCPHCRGQNHPEARWCQFCGLQFSFSYQSLSSQPAMSQEEIHKESKKKNGCMTLLLWIVFFPVMFSVLAYKKRNIFLYILACLIWLVYGIFFLANYSVMTSPEYKAMRTETAIYESIYAKYTEDAKPTQTPIPTATNEIDRSIRAIMEGANIDEQSALKAIKVIRSVGFNSVYELDFIMDYDMLKAYSADLGYTKKYNITFLNNEIFGISNSSGTVFYDRDAGGVIDNIGNYTFTDEDKSSFYYATEQITKASLVAPSTAKFPSLVWNSNEWQFARKKDLVQVITWVDSQNSFGAMIRNEVYAEYSYSTRELTCFVLGGQLMYGTCSEIK